MEIEERRVESIPEYVEGLPVGAIVRALKGILFGSVQIIVQDAKVVQIERTEKSRLDSRRSS